MTTPSASAAHNTTQALDARDVANFLQARLPSLFAVVDAARGETLTWLKQAELPYQSLFGGAKAKELRDEAPYLVRLSDDREKLASLTGHLWGRAGGLFLQSERPFYDVRRQLRGFLMVNNEAGETLYFRYYDPRVAAPFLPTCDGEQARTIFGNAIDAYLYEDDEDGCLKQCTRRDPNLARDAHVASDASAAPDSTPPCGVHIETLMWPV